MITILKKVKLSDIQGMLSKNEMKQIMAGYGGGGCPGYGAYCSTADHINCCNTLICSDFTCQFPTLTND